MSATIMVSEQEIAALSKSELVRLVRRICTAGFMRVTKVDVLSARAEEARDQADATFRAYTAASGNERSIYIAYIEAIRRCTAAQEEGNPRTVRKAVKAMEDARAHEAAARKEREKLWSAYQRLDRHADRLWKQLEEEWSKRSDSAF